jgi:chromosomal replication initiation ATPase DnaA
VSDESFRSIQADGVSSDFASVWARFCHEIEVADVLGPKDRAFVKMIVPMALVGDTALLSVEDDYSKGTVETRLRDLITSGLGQVLGQEIRIAVTVVPNPDSRSSSGDGSAMNAQLPFSPVRMLTPSPGSEPAED